MEASSLKMFQIIMFFFLQITDVIIIWVVSSVDFLHMGMYSRDCCLLNVRHTIINLSMLGLQEGQDRMERRSELVENLATAKK